MLDKKARVGFLAAFVGVPAATWWAFVLYGIFRWIDAWAAVAILLLAVAIWRKPLCGLFRRIFGLDIPFFPGTDESGFDAAIQLLMLFFLQTFALIAFLGDRENEGDLKFFVFCYVLSVIIPLGAMSGMCRARRGMFHCFNKPTVRFLHWAIGFSFLLACAVSYGAIEKYFLRPQLGPQDLPITSVQDKEFIRDGYGIQITSMLDRKFYPAGVPNAVLLFVSIPDDQRDAWEIRQVGADFIQQSGEVVPNTTPFGPENTEFEKVITVADYIGLTSGTRPAAIKLHVMLRPVKKKATNEEIRSIKQAIKEGKVIIRDLRKPVE